MTQGSSVGGHHNGASELLSTKLFVPPARPGFVARQRLNELLDLGEHVKLALVAAPVGFGKSALLGGWVRERHKPAAWLSLDNADNDPARFWRYVMASLDRVRPGMSGKLEQGMTQNTAPVESVLDDLINNLARDSEPATIILDDYDVINSPEVCSSVQHFVDRSPPHTTVVIASRSTPELNLGRLRAAGELVEIGPSELRFDIDEAREMLELATGAALSAEALRTLTDRTEGWVAGLQLAALSLREKSDIDGFVTSFTGGHRLVVDYLSSEVLASQSTDIRDFLMCTSVLERLSAGLCNALTDRSDSQQVLEGVERANLFLIPLDDVRGWWRYHHLFRELLRTRLAAQADGPELERELNRRASAWHEANGNEDEAIAHALSAGDAQRAAGLVERYADAHLLLNEGATVRGWLTRLPPDVLAARPRLLLAQANLALVSGDHDAFGAPFEAAERALQRTTAETNGEFEPTVGRGASLLVNMPASLALGRAHLAELQGDPDATRSNACLARSLLEADEWMLEILVSVHLAIADFLNGSLERAAAGFDATLDLCRHAGEKVVAGRDAELLGLCYRGLGRLDDADAIYNRAREYLTSPADRRLRICGRVLGAMAGIAYQRNDLDVAESLLEESVPLCRDLAASISGSPQPLANALASQAWTRHARGERRAARQAMADALDCAPGREVATILNPVEAENARMDIANGDLASATAWAAEHKLDANDNVAYPSEPDYLVLARLLTATDEPAKAETLLDRLESNATDRIGSLIEIAVLKSLALRSVGDEEGALSNLARGIQMAAGQRWTRVFVDEGPPMYELLQSLAAGRPALRPDDELSPESHAGRHLRTLLTAFEMSPRTDSSGLPEPLTEREHEVLRLLVQGRPNAQIADQLFVTQDTVKKHVTHILGKLGVDNRTQAAARARELEIAD